MNSRKAPRKKNLSAMKMLGVQLGTARRAAGLTQRELGEQLMLDEETVASIEQGRRPLKPDLAELLDELLDTRGLLAAGVANLPEIDQFPMWAELYVQHEREAIALSWYDALVVPGLLQTREYARALLAGRAPPRCQCLRLESAPWRPFPTRCPRWRPTRADARSGSNSRWGD